MATRWALILAMMLGAAPSGGAEAPAAEAGEKVRAADKSYEQLKILVEIMHLVQENYVASTELSALVAGAADGIVRTLDPFSQYLDAEAHGEVKTETEGQFGGLGIRIGVKDEWLTVITPMPGTPAYRLGILPNDRIVEIDGQTTKEVSLNEALEKLRGAPGTRVKLTIMREGDAPPGAPKDADRPWATKEFALTREIVKIESVQSWAMADGIGFIRIIEFSAKTLDDVKDALADFKKQGLGAVVLDLRNNPGGLLSSAVDTSALFLGGSKLIVYTQGRRPDSRQDFRAGAQAPYGELPLVVLVNEGSASGAEILAGALQDHRRALVMGMRTFGKASVQSVIPLVDGAGLRLTVAHYYTPNGRAIHRDEKAGTGGIPPDIEVRVPREVEAKLYNQWDLIYSPGKKPRSSIKKEELVRDETLERALELLKARAVLKSLDPKAG